MNVQRENPCTTVPIRLIIADEMLPIREYLKMALSCEDDIRVVATAETGVDAVERSLATRPDVLLMDLEMETPLSVLEAIKTITANVPGIRVVVSSLFRDDENISTAYKLGASDFILKNAPTDKIVETIRSVAYRCVQ